MEYQWRADVVREISKQHQSPAFHFGKSGKIERQSVLFVDLDRGSGRYSFTLIGGHLPVYLDQVEPMRQGNQKLCQDTQSGANFNHRLRFTQFGALHDTHGGRRLSKEVLAEMLFGPASG